MSCQLSPASWQNLMTAVTCQLAESCVSWQHLMTGVSTRKQWSNRHVSRSLWIPECVNPLSFFEIDTSLMVAVDLTPLSPSPSPFPCASERKSVVRISTPWLVSRTVSAWMRRCTTTSRQARSWRWVTTTPNVEADPYLFCIYLHICFLGFCLIFPDEEMNGWLLFMNMCTFCCICVCVFPLLYSYIHVFTYVCMYVCMYVRMYTEIQISMHTC